MEKTENDIENKIRSELNAGFPVVAYLDDILHIRIVRNGHTVVFDGIADDKGITYVQVNFGWAGESDGWYDLRILAHERKLLYIFSFRPLYGEPSNQIQAIDTTNIPIKKGNPTGLFLSRIHLEESRYCTTGCNFCPFGVQKKSESESESELA